MKRKILCFHPALAPYRIDFFNALAARSDFHLALLNTNLLNQKFNQDALRAQLKCNVTYLLRGFQWRGRYWRFGVTKLIRKERPDVIIGCEFSPVTCFLALIRRLFGLRFKLFTTTDDNEELFAKCHGPRRFLRGFVLRHVDGIIVTDLAVKAPAQEIARNKDLKVVDIPIVSNEQRLRRNAAIAFERACAWRQANLAAGDRALFFVGRLTAVKNLRWLIARVADARWPRAFKLFIVGSGEQDGELKSLVADFGLDKRVVFCGRKEGAELDALFAAADALVLPSTSETFGAVVAECLQWGGKVIVSTHVGAKVIVDQGDNGEIFEADDADAFFCKLQCLANGIPRWSKGRPSLLHFTLEEKIDALMESLS